jgi:hypothetical protein
LQKIVTRAAGPCAAVATFARNTVFPLRQALRPAKAGLSFFVAPHVPAPPQMPIKIL